MIRILPVVFLVVLALQAVTCVAQEQESQSRVWETANGKFSVSAVFLGVEDGKVRLKRDDNGRIAMVPIDVLSDKDREYLNDLAKKADESTESQKAEAAKAEAAKTEAAKTEAAKTEEPKAEAPKTDARPLNPPTQLEKPPESDTPPSESGNSSTSDDAGEPLNPPMTEDKDPPPTGSPTKPSESTETTPDTLAKPYKEKSRKPIVPFRSTKRAEDKASPTLPGNEGIVSSGSEDSVSSDQAPPTKPRAAIDMSASEKPTPKIDIANLRVEKLAIDERLKSIGDQQLIDSLHLRSEIRWKGDVKLDHLLTPIKPNFEVLLFAENSTALAAATNIGHVKINEMVDGQGTKFEAAVFPPGVINAWSDWIKITTERENRFVATKDLETSAVVSVEFVRPQFMPRKMQKLTGEFQLRFGVETQKFSLSNADTHQGEIVHPMLAQRGLQIIVRRPDTVTLVVELKGNVSDVSAVKSLANGESTTGAIRTASNDTGFVQFNFRKQIPESTELVFEVLTDTRTLTVPFEFKDVQLVLPDSKGDATAG